MAERTAVAASAPRALVLLCALASVFSPARAQTVPDQPTANPPDQTPGRRRIAPEWGGMAFETATVKLNTSVGQREESNFPIGIYDWYLPVGGVFSAKNYPLLAYISFAYKISGNDAVSFLPQLPAWVRTTRYDIQAQAPDHMATKDQMRLMMQSLLADRFNLKIHSETRTVPVYALVLSTPGKTGPQLQPHPPGDKTCSTKASNKMDGMFPATCSGITPIKPAKSGNYRFGARNLDFTRIVSFLPGFGLGRQVLDQTGLSGQYDFNLEWTPVRTAPIPATIMPAEPDQPSAPAQSDQPSAPAQPDPSLANFTRALDLQLGLKLIPQDAPMPVPILDHLDHPPDN
jgi:uncharacterized protein (TIGR03435 family)